MARTPDITPIWYNRGYMIVLRIAWRVIIFLLVIAGAYVTTFLFIPYLDRRLNIFPAALLGYAFFAYFVLPLILRLWRVVFRPNHIPRYCITPDGWPADPVNIAIVARSEKHLIKAMQSAGWYKADKGSLRNWLRELKSIIFATPYPTAPFSSFYLFGRKFDIGFQIPTGRNNSPRHRHHVRLWQLIYQPETDKNNDFAYWLKRLKSFFGRRKTVWIGAAIRDIHLAGVRWRNLQITHHSGDHIGDRDLIINSLQEAGYVKKVYSVKDGEPFKMRTQNIARPLIVDGNVKVVELR